MRHTTRARRLQLEIGGLLVLALCLLPAASAGAFPRPKGATPVLVALTTAFAPCTAPNSTHNGPIDDPSCVPPVYESHYVTPGIGEQGSTLKPPQMRGSVRLDSVVGDPDTPANEADALIRMITTDVRRKSDLGDYTGQLRGVLGLRITDRFNGGGPDPATMEDITFPFTVPCVATADSTIGATCALSTSANTIIPAVVQESRRTLWEVDQIKVFDGGADEVADTTADNTLFATQGIFIP
jgi:hypothetical protein